jgi:hypothetical protein
LPLLVVKRVPLHFADTSLKIQKNMDFDEVLDEVKHFGKFQATNYLLLSVAILFAAMFEASFIFTAGDLEYRYTI